MQDTLRSLFGAAADNVPLLYGGSVNPGNVSGFAAQGCIHGALVGGASLQADQFVEIVRITARAKGLT
jgi:triosephosphate isomerase